MKDEEAEFRMKNEDVIPSREDGEESGAAER
jgi:hypothetical protein